MKLSLLTLFLPALVGSASAQARLEPMDWAFFARLAEARNCLQTEPPDYPCAERTVVELSRRSDLSRYERGEVAILDEAIRARKSARVWARRRPGSPKNRHWRQRAPKHFDLIHEIVE